MASSSSTGQLSPLSAQKRFITTHDSEAKAVVQSADAFQWQALDGDKMAFSVVYTTSQFPADLNNEADITAHNAVMKKGPGLVNPGGTVIRCVDFAPGYRCGMHRTQSLDYGIVLDGDIDMLLDSGEVHHMKAGDVAVQRATNHQWLNASDTKWARMMFVLQDCQALEVGGKTLSEDLGKDLNFLPPSRQ
ncbi:hypothetical protein M406DRAFT_323637 [Cryphonectria parasitica EP155]|uniref:Cupin type-2 domain-containing protein n=1 Tax=Cryphonectria parasitica (strain ATCC 38755 / EP155) TaxID=660469 RepID=A0A9P4XY23_CRYP1|nr:uncharacterized protein M406DRAFT_323637 [Cryphonectria parasitica EP155]KAF3762630.1 hypothetical protein M406DRAFT_323637 [Cryphonectria parasitica EP155]